LRKKNDGEVQNASDRGIFGAKKSRYGRKEGNDRKYKHCGRKTTGKYKTQVIVAFSGQGKAGTTQEEGK